MRETIKKSRIIAIMRKIPLEKAVDFAKICVDGGITAFEVALNSEDALKEIYEIKNRLGDKLTVGAGTAITPALAENAVNAGAEFLLTPSVHTDVFDWCKENSVRILPGVFTPSDVACCVRYGIDTFKLFPAGELPLHYIKSLKGPFDGTEYVAVGGVSAANIREFFGAGFIGAGIGSGLFPQRLLYDGEHESAVECVKELLRNSV